MSRGAGREADVVPDRVDLSPAGGPLRGVVRVPGDKSISHRAAILAAMAAGTSEIRDHSPAGDCGATLTAIRRLGIAVEERGDVVRIRGAGSDALRASDEPLDCARSGTTMRLLAGVLAARPFPSTLTGDAQLLRRPMERVAEPLRRMGATVTTVNGRPPLRIEGGPLTGIRYRLPVPSAQVKSAVLLAGIQAEGETTVLEPIPSRDHTERLLGWLDLPIERGPDSATVRAAVPEPFALRVPGDLSSAAPLVAAAALVAGSELTVEGVGLNPTRTGFLRVLERMGAALEVSIHHRSPEPVGNVRLRHGRLHGVAVGPEEIPTLLDELPLLGVVATAAEGTTEVRGAGELRVKESDRIAGLVAGLRTLGAEAEELDDGFVVRGPTALGGGGVDALGDHRLVMAFAVAALASREPVGVSGSRSLGDSFPGFLEHLEDLR